MGQAVISIAGTSHHQVVEGLPKMTNQDVTGRVRVDAAAPSSIGHQCLVALRSVDPATAWID